MLDVQCSMLNAETDSILTRRRQVLPRLISRHAGLFSAMNTRQIIFSYAIATLAFLFAACASNKVDWDGRVGNYTYDQALVEFGPPDKMAMLSDQSKVAEWYTRGNSGMAVGLGTGVGTSRSHSSSGVGFGVGVPVTSSSWQKRRLVFGPDGVLKSWSK